MVPSQALVTVKLWDVTLAKAIRAVLEDVSQPGSPLGYEVDEGVITISTQADFGCSFMQCEYDVHDIDMSSDDLLALIDEYVGPESWGESTSMSCISGFLIVTQTAMQHRRIASKLDELRASRPRPEELVVEKKKHSAWFWVGSGISVVAGLITIGWAVLLGVKWLIGRLS